MMKFDALLVQSVVVSLVFLILFLVLFALFVCIGQCVFMIVPFNLVDPVFSVVLSVTDSPDVVTDKVETGSTRITGPNIKTY